MPSKVINPAERALPPYAFAITPTIEFPATMYATAHCSLPRPAHASLRGRDARRRDQGPCGADLQAPPALSATGALAARSHVATVEAMRHLRQIQTLAPDICGASRERA